MIDHANQLPGVTYGGKCVVVLSGGMDSATLLHLVMRHHMVPIAVSFNYGQKHGKELDYARQQVMTLSERTHTRIEHKIIDVRSLTAHISKSALTSDAPVPEGHYAADNMKQTVVPNRNMIMMSIAAGIAVNENAVAVATGVHAGDHFVYPDCRPEFIADLEATIKSGNEGFGHPALFVYAPFLHLGKHDIAQIGDVLGVDYSNTWSCYNGRELHCGVCGTCAERKEAFDLAGVVDPTMYEDTEVKV
jgi:7-cyano-7-deazaguanine synthase